MKLLKLYVADIAQDGIYIIIVKDLCGKRRRQIQQWTWVGLLDRTRCEELFGQPMHGRNNYNVDPRMTLKLSRRNSRQLNKKNYLEQLSRKKRIFLQFLGFLRLYKLNYDVHTRYLQLFSHFLFYIQILYGLKLINLDEKRKETFDAYRCIENFKFFRQN